MNNYWKFPSDFEPANEVTEPGSILAQIGLDERRMHVRAHNYWVSLLDGQDYPSIEDLELGDHTEFAPHSLLLDLTSGREDPAMPYIGAAIREECGIAHEVQSIQDVPGRSLLSRLTDHYMQIIANRAPVGFEAEFVNQRGENICYRGLLMPLSSDGDTIDFIYGVISWKKVAQAEHPPLAPAPAQPFAEMEADDKEPLELEQTQVVGGTLPWAEATGVDGAVAGIQLDHSAGLAERLWSARESAEAAKAADGRSRDALYRTLAYAYDFALASKGDPDGYAGLLEDSGVKAQARAPMTPIVKLVFGIDYDKARLTEYSAALSYAERNQVEFGGFLSFVETQAGGLKSLVVAERQARRPEPRLNTRTEKAREQLRAAGRLSLTEISSDEEFALVLTRRSSDGLHEAVALVGDPALVERAIRRVAE